MKRCIDCGAELEDNARFCSDCGASQPEIVDDEDVQAGETLPAVMGARVVGTLHRAVSAAGGAKFLGRVADEADDTVAWREEQFKCELPVDTTINRYRENIRGIINADINENSSAVITGLDVDDSSVITKIIIPDAIEDMPVVGIAGKVFNGLSALEEVTLPDSIVVIDESAFQTCNSLKSINLPKSLTIVGVETFRDCSALKYVTAPNGFDSRVAFLKLSSDDAPNTFQGCHSLSLKSKSLLRTAGYTGSF